MSATDVPGTTGLDTGNSTKDPTGWAYAQSQPVDTTGLNIPNSGVKTSYAQLYQAIEADALHGSACGALWGQIRPILIAQAKNYTTKELASKGWIDKDAIGLKAFLTGLYNTNAVNPTAPMSAQTWISQKANDVATTGTTTFAPHKILAVTSTATPAEQIADILNNYVAPRAKALGSNATPAQLNAIATKAWNDGTYAQPNVIDEQILGNTDVGKTLVQDATPNALGGEIGTVADQMRTIAKNYGIPVPSNPAQFENFVKDAVGPGGDVSKFTEYAKAQALNLYPWMKGFLTGGDGSTATGGTVAGYLAPYTSNLAATLNIPTTSIDWTDPKWQSVVAQKDPKTGVSVPQTLDQAIQTVKTDPRFGYSKTPNAINEAYANLDAIGQMFGKQG